MAFLMEKSGSRSVCEAQREGFWVGGSSLISPIVLHTPHTNTLSLLFPSMITDHILEKMVSLIDFRQILPKHLTAARILSYTGLVWKILLELNPSLKRKF